MESFTAIDFETAQGYRWSICQVGLIRVEKGIITKELNILVQPPNNYYWSRDMIFLINFFIGVEGIRGPALPFEWTVESGTDST